MFSSYNKRINDIRECKEQALSHAYVHNLFTNPFMVFLFVHHTQKKSFVLWFISLPIFPVLIHLYSCSFSRFPPLTVISAQPPAFSLSLRKCHPETLPSSYLHPSFVRPPPFVSPAVSSLLLSSLLIPSSPFIFSFILPPSPSSAYFCPHAGLTRKCQNTI